MVLWHLLENVWLVKISEEIMNQSEEFTRGVQWALKEAQRIYNIQHPSARVPPYILSLKRLAWEWEPKKEKILAETSARLANWNL